MPIHPCPNCQELAPRWLEAPSNIAVVNYYRCQVCRHVFTVSKDNGAIHHVTAPKALPHRNGSASATTIGSSLGLQKGPIPR
jgi:hypothetical protein